MDIRATIQRSLDYIEENLQAEITAAELAEQAGFSLFHYYRLFQSATGMPVMQYILRRRLLHGIYAIDRGSGKTDAALAYGFDTYAGFYRAFCREFGCPPSDFTKSCRVRRPYRIDLTKEAHRIVTHKKAARILKHWNLEKETVTDIYYDETGNQNEHACYVGENYILKYTADPDKLTRHIAVSKAIENTGLCAAVPIPTADGREYVPDGELYFYLTPRLPGAQISPRSFFGGEQEGNARFVGEIIGQLHLVLSKVEGCVHDADLPATLRDWALPRAGDALGLDAAFCRAFLDTLTDLYPRLPRQIIHRDPNPGNIICAGDRWGFIDFDLSERNARIYDPCYAATAVLSECFGSDNEKWLEIYRDILFGYDSVVRLTEEERRAIPYVVLANQFVCVAWFSDQEKYGELFEINKQMTLWLLSRLEDLKKF